MDALGWEVFEMPSSEQLPLVLANGFLGFLFNCCFVASLALLNPLLVSITCLLTIPITAVVDILLNHSRPPDQQVIFNAYNISGLVAVAVGFLIFVIPQRKGAGLKDSEG